MDSEIAQENEVAPADEEIALSELNQSIWSVVSFDKCLNNNLTYDEAILEMERLNAEKVSGLCIITDEAAARI